MNLRKDKKRNTVQMEQRDIASKKLDINLTITIITLTVNCLNTSVKR